MKLAVIGGDGIGPEVTAEALKVLRTVRDDITVTEFSLGADRYLSSPTTIADVELSNDFQVTPGLSLETMRLRCNLGC